MEFKGRNDGHRFDYSKIADRVYIGSDLCRAGVCKIHGEEFRDLGIGFELNLSQENNELPPKDMRVGYLWLPVADGHSPTQVQLDIGTAAINSVVESGDAVYVHCKNGHGRSPTLVVAYLVRYKGYNLLEAQSLVKEERPEIHIEDSQIQELEKFEERWSK